MGRIKNAVGETFESPYADTIGNEERSILYIEIANSGIAETVNAFSSPEKTSVIEFDEYDGEETRLFTGYTKLYEARIMPENGDIMIRLEKRTTM